MRKFAVNYNDLEVSLSPKPQVFRYDDVKDRLRKIAFDVVRFVDGDDISGLWTVQKTDDGDVIVAKYDDLSGYTQVEKTASVKTDWKALADQEKENIHVFYKDSPVTKISMAVVGIPSSDIDIVCRFLPEKLATNESLVSNMFAEMPLENYKELVSAHPELGSFAATLGTDEPEKLPCGCSPDCTPCKLGKATKGKCLCKK